MHERAVAIGAAAQAGGMQSIVFSGGHPPSFLTR